MNLPDQRRILLPFYFALTLAAGITLGYWLFFDRIRLPGPQSGSDKFRDFIGLLDKEYVDTINPDMLTEKAIKTILTDLDPHSVYFSENEASLAGTMLESDFEGIGIEFQMVNDTLQITSLSAGGPAEKAGLHQGDRIISANGQRIAGNDAVKLAFEQIRGKKGSNVHLDIVRPGFLKGIFSKDVIRDVITSGAVDAALLFDDGIAYLKVNRFSENSFDECIDSLDVLRKKGMKSLILDLRDNTGGYLEKATRLADEFLGQKELLVYTKGRSNKYCQYYYSNPGGLYSDLPLIILVNEGTASASEILAGAMQDHDRGLILGRRTFGKGLVQVPLNLQDGSELRLTISRYFTPSGRCIQKPFNTSNYDEDLDERLASGELFEADSIRPDKKEIFKTSKGRVVYGGGGIIPDIFVSLDTVGVNSFITRLMEQNLFREFAISWKQKNSDRFRLLRNTKAGVDFNPGDAVLIEFVAFAEKKGILWPEGKQKLATDFFLSQTIKSYIAEQIWGSQFYYRITSEKDPCIRMALRLIPEARKMLFTTKK